MIGFTVQSLNTTIVTRCRRTIFETIVDCTFYLTLNADATEHATTTDFAYRSARTSLQNTFRLSADVSTHDRLLGAAPRLWQIFNCIKRLYQDLFQKAAMDIIKPHRGEKRNSKTNLIFWRTLWRRTVVPRADPC